MEAVQAQVLSHYGADWSTAFREGPCPSARRPVDHQIGQGIWVLLWRGARDCLAYADGACSIRPSHLLAGDQSTTRGQRPRFAPWASTCFSQTQGGGGWAAARGDVVIIPAFGTEVETKQKLIARDRTVDTTCGDVMSVWSEWTIFQECHQHHSWQSQTRRNQSHHSQATATGRATNLVVYN